MAEIRLGGPVTCERMGRERVDTILSYKLTYHKKKAAALKSLLDLMVNMTADQEQDLSELPWFRLLEEGR